MLNRGWLIKHDPDNAGREEKWFTGLPKEGGAEAQAPGLVHLYLPDCFGIAWYQVRFFDTLSEGGRRILLRCSHTGNFYAGTNNQVSEPAMWMQDFNKAKATGFNTVRFISGAALPDQLDYCDELGLMVYEEPYAGWLTENGPRAREVYEEDMLTMVKRDRSHACLTMFGTLNETQEVEPWGQFPIIAKDCLGAVRDLDETRLIIYSSGRFDGNSGVGSVANPFSREWECLWNGENKENGKTQRWVPEKGFLSIWAG